MQEAAESDSLTPALPLRENGTETGLYYYRARYYDPAAGRFVSEDPSGFRAEINFYRYVFDRPVDFGDPLGLQVEGNANTWTYGEFSKYSWLPTPGYPAPPGLGDAKASIAAACTLNGGGCHAWDGSALTDPISKAAWNNIVNANGTDKSGGGNYMCVDTEHCTIQHRCTSCVNGKPTLGERPTPLKPSGTVTVQGHTLYFYSDPLLGWCNEKDKNSGCKCANKGR